LLVLWDSSSGDNKPSLVKGLLPDIEVLPVHLSRRGPEPDLSTDIWGQVGFPPCRHAAVSPIAGKRRKLATQIKANWSWPRS